MIKPDLLKIEAFRRNDVEAMSIYPMCIGNFTIYEIQNIRKQMNDWFDELEKYTKELPLFDGKYSIRKLRGHEELFELWMDRGILNIAMEHNPIRKGTAGAELFEIHYYWVNKDEGIGYAIVDNTSDQSREYYEICGFSAEIVNEEHISQDTHKLGNCPINTCNYNTNLTCQKCDDDWKVCQRRLIKE